VPDHCEDNGYGLAITADKDEAVRAALTLVNEPDWQRINVPPDTSDEEQYIREWACESVHTMNESEHSYRIIFLHKERRQGDLIRLLPGDLGRVWSREFAFLTDREP